MASPEAQSVMQTEASLSVNWTQSSLSHTSKQQAIAMSVLDHGPVFIDWFCGKAPLGPE
jgi:hypothetical protein